MSTAEDIDENEMEIANEEEDMEIDEDIDAVEQEELEENIDQDFVETNEPEVEEDHDINGNISVSPEEYQILVDKEIASLKYLLHQTKKEITQVKQENVVLTELLIRRKFRNIAEVRPSFGRDRKKRSADGPPGPEKEKTKKGKKNADPSSAQLVGGAPSSNISPPPNQPLSLTVGGSSITLTSPQPTTEEKPLSLKITIKKPSTATKPSTTTPNNNPDNNTDAPVKQPKKRVSKSASKISLTESIQSEVTNITNNTNINL
eukprot:gene9239-10028_t